MSAPSQLRPKRPWMPFYVADYLADTTHLSTMEHGAYVLLLLDYWRNGGLPGDTDQLARIVRLTTKEWAKVSVTIACFFGPNWTHKRLDHEISRAAEISDIKRQSVNKRRDRRRTYVGTDVGSCVPANETSDVDTLHTSQKVQTKNLRGLQKGGAGG